MAAGIAMTIFVKKETIFVSRQNSIAKKMTQEIFENILSNNHR
jgi:hypothetical protein